MKTLTLVLLTIFLSPLTDIAEGYEPYVQTWLERNNQYWQDQIQHNLRTQEEQSVQFQRDFSDRVYGGIQQNYLNALQAERMAKILYPPKPDPNLEEEDISEKQNLDDNAFWDLLIHQKSAPERQVIPAARYKHEERMFMIRSGSDILKKILWGND